MAKRRKEKEKRKREQVIQLRLYCSSFDGGSSSHHYLNSRALCCRCCCCHGLLIATVARTRITHSCYECLNKVSAVMNFYVDLWRPCAYLMCFFALLTQLLGRCVGALGMESGTIRDEDIAASSSFDGASVGPHNAR